MKEDTLPESLRSTSVPEVSSSECIKYKNLVHTSSVTHIFNPCAAFVSEQSKRQSPQSDQILSISINISSYLL